METRHLSLLEVNTFRAFEWQPACPGLLALVAAGSLLLASTCWTALAIKPCEFLLGEDGKPLNNISHLRNIDLHGGWAQNNCLIYLNIFHEWKHSSLQMETDGSAPPPGESSW